MFLVRALAVTFALSATTGLMAAAQNAATPDVKQNKTQDNAPEPTPSVAAGAKQRFVTLASAIELAVHNNLDLDSKVSLVAQAEARQGQALAALFPKVIGNAILSPIYSVTGNALDSISDTSKWGVWVQSTVTIIQPVYTWGRISGFREAAAHGTEVARAQFRKDSNQLTYEVKELFYGAVLAEQLYNFLEEGKNDVADLINKAEEDQKKKRPQIAKRDYFRLKVFAAEANYRFEEAKKLRQLVRHALSLKLGFDPEEETIPQDTQLSPIDSPVPSESELVDRMASHRPEFTQLTSGIAAKKALLDAEKANKFPMLFAGGLLQFNYSNMREPQKSAYSFDPYNRHTGGAGVGVQWTWDFATTLANESYMRTEIDELERKQVYAKAGFRVELKKTLSELYEARANLESSKEAFRVGRKWLVSESMGYSIGLTEVKNLIDAYLARAKTAADHWQAIYKVNMSWADLSRVVGTEITPGLTAVNRPISQDGAK